VKSLGPTLPRVIFSAATSTDVRRQPPLEGGCCGGLAVIGEKLSYLKQSVRVEIRWLHGPPSMAQTSSQRSIWVAECRTYGNEVRVLDLHHPESPLRAL
jgi:hypothetical protein